jgi:hypothetical protein
MSICAFCSREAVLTGEHLWSAWIGKALGKRKFTITRKEKDGTARSWHRKDLNEKTNIACHNCNHGWMSDLETRTSTFLDSMILHCSDIELQPDQIEVLAQVTFKNAVVADHMHDNRPAFFTLTERRRFKESWTIPDGVQMWLASTPRQKGLFKCGYASTVIGTSNGFELNHFTYGAGHLVVQMTACKWKKKAHRRHLPPPYVTQNLLWNDVSVPFWPKHTKRTHWPPKKHLGDEVIDTFVERWANLQRGNF